MANASLAARYRPQTFAQVVGQDMVKTVLSRAAQEDRVAPAYLLSGTRGVGKTTVARVFAKALNCARAPAAEPCNECEACRRITQGSFVDVVEIDGASNRGIDDVRRLREAVGYAPLEGRYKVFIIDEAHMLTKEAFNALLKTLEEPPARVTFVLATTEQHKFPVTIVSRCQHFVFRPIAESVLEAHIASVLGKEERDFEPEAARLVARRAAGSVRDAMSLLGQTLALLDAGPLTAKLTRDVLGLAGQEIMDRLLDALARRDALAVAALVRDLLRQGVDMGFFLRELGTLWRNLFLLKQAGAAAAPDVDLPEADVKRLLDAAPRFTLAFIHAAWQMTLDGQRRILTSLEPAAGLELLLLNLALLPDLLPIGELNADVLASQASQADQTAPAPARPAAPSPEPASPEPVLPEPAMPEPPSPEPVLPEARPTPPAAPATPESSPRTAAVPPPSAASPAPVAAATPEAMAPQTAPAQAAPAPEPSAPERETAAPETPFVWDDFLAFCNERTDVSVPALRQSAGEERDGVLTISPRSQVMFTQIDRSRAALESLASAWAKRPLRVELVLPRTEKKTEAELRAEMGGHPVVQSMQTLFDAALIRCTPAEPDR